MYIIKNFWMVKKLKIIEIDGKKIGNGKPGSVTKKMMGEYIDIVMNKDENYSHWLTSVY